ncbi:MAG: rod shape-determining protein MreD [Elusimicrobiota bacterium]
MRYLAGVFVFFVGVLVQWLWSTHFTAWGLSPQVLLILTVAVAARSGPVAGQCYGFAWGLFLDVSSAHVFGANALALTVVGYVIGVLRRQMDVESLAPQILFVIMLTPVYFVFFGVTGLIFEHNFLWAGWVKVLLEPVYNCVLAPLGFAFVRRFVDF